jgi:hypothetical protein
VAAIMKDYDLEQQLGRLFSQLRTDEIEVDLQDQDSVHF